MRGCTNGAASIPRRGPDGPNSFARSATIPSPPVRRAPSLSPGVGFSASTNSRSLDVADAMILGRLFEQLSGPRCRHCGDIQHLSRIRLYEGGINRQLFLPFISLIEEKLDVVELGGRPGLPLGTHRRASRSLCHTARPCRRCCGRPRAWSPSTDGMQGLYQRTMTVLRLISLVITLRNENDAARLLRPTSSACSAARGRRLSRHPARPSSYAWIDHIPFLLLGPLRRDEARAALTVLIDTLYDEGVEARLLRRRTTRCPLYFDERRYGRLPPYRVASSRNAEP